MLNNEDKKAHKTNKQPGSSHSPNWIHRDPYWLELRAITGAKHGLTALSDDYFMFGVVLVRIWPNMIMDTWMITLENDKRTFRKMN